MAKDNLESVLANINKKFGKGTIMSLGDQAPVQQNLLSSGLLLVDKILGGGVAYGRITELYGLESSGKSTLSLQFAAQCQKDGGTVAYVDVENALDVTYAKKLGVNTDALIFTQPSSGEQALEIVDMLASSGNVNLIIVDSVAALTPQAELDGEMGDQNIGLLARLMSKAMRKLTGTLNEKNCAVIFINQIREKVSTGFSMGCLQGDTLVTFEDGSKRYIADVVNKKIKGKVWSYDEVTKKFELAEILDWHDNGVVNDMSEYIKFEFRQIADQSHGNHKGGITVTPNHLVMTDTGWKQAKDITKSDKLISMGKFKINSTLADFLWGTFVGDCTILNRTEFSANICLQDNANQEYMHWKANKISKFIPLELYGSGNRLRYKSKQSYELAYIKKELGQRDPEIFLKSHYSDLGLALWYMDDGCLHENRKASISFARYHDQTDKISSIINSFYEATAIKPRYTSDAMLIIYKKDFDNFFGRIAKYIPECMQYKLPPEYRGQYIDFELNSTEEVQPIAIDILNITQATKRQAKNKHKYDLTIDNNHTYVAGGKYNGVVVHNSNETTTGGKALKFAASQRIELRKTTAIKNGDQVIGTNVKIKVVKNKIAPPMRVAEVPMIFGEGFSAKDEVIDLAIEYELISKSGAWFTTHDGVRLQGKESVKAYYKQNAESAADLREKVKARLNGVEFEQQYEVDPETGEVIM